MFGQHSLDPHAIDDDPRRKYKNCDKNYNILFHFSRTAREQHFRNQSKRIVWEFQCFGMKKEKTVSQWQNESYKFYQNFRPIAYPKKQLALAECFSTNETSNTTWSSTCSSYSIFPRGAGGGKWKQFFYLQRLEFKIQNFFLLEFF